MKPYPLNRKRRWKKIVPYLLLILLVSGLWYWGTYRPVPVSTMVLLEPCHDNPVGRAMAQVKQDVKRGKR